MIDEKDQEMSPLDMWTARANRAVVLCAALATLWGLVTGRVPQAIVDIRTALEVIYRLNEEDVFKDIASMQQGFISLRDEARIEQSVTAEFRGTVIRQIGQLTDAVEVIRAEQARQGGEIEELAAPRSVFILHSDNSHPVGGFCVEGEPCEVVLQIRRDARAVDCVFVPGTTRWAFYNPRTNVFSPAQRLDNPVGRNIGTTWERIPLTIQTPTGLEPGAEFTFSASYTDCPWMDEDEGPRVYTSAPLKFDVRVQ